MSGTKSPRGPDTPNAGRPATPEARTAPDARPGQLEVEAARDVRAVVQALIRLGEHAGPAEVAEYLRPGPGVTPDEGEVASILVRLAELAQIPPGPDRPSPQEGARGPGDGGGWPGRRNPEVPWEGELPGGLSAGTGGAGDPARRPAEVLVVDDDPAVLGMLAAALRSEGLTVCLAGSGGEALALYRRHGTAVGVVLLDVRMAPPDGPQTLVALRQLDPGVRAVFMSGDTGPYSAEELLGMGAGRVIAKPFRSMAEVAQALREQMLLGSSGLE
jgi:two-component system, OmpR family, response regulator